MQGGVAVAEEGVLEQRLLLLAVGAAEVVVQPLRLVSTSWRGTVAAGSQSR